MADKKLYQGIFNYQRQVVEEFTRSDSVAGAYRNMTARLAVRFNTTGYTMRQYFDGKRRNYEIIEVKDTLIDKTNKTYYNGVERRKHGV